MPSFCLTLIAVMLTCILAAPCGGDYASDRQVLLSIPGKKSGKTGPVDALPPKKRRKCCPYDFNGKLCQVVGDRILCGYNRNIGRPAGDNDVSVELSGGCRIRKGRLECGYDGVGPFVNKRRPPAWDTNQVAEEYDVANENVSEKIVEQNRTQLKYIVPSTQKPSGGTTKCIEIKDRIVCKD